MDAWQIVTTSIAMVGLAQLGSSLPSSSADPADPTIPASGSPVAQSPARAGDPVVFLVLDGVRWQEIFGGVDPGLGAGTNVPRLTAEGLMPHLHAIRTTRGAALGAPGRAAISASGPRFVSLPSYREIFSGTAARDCLDNACPPIDRPTLVDELRDQGGRAAVFASWPTIARAAAAHADRVVISTGCAGEPCAEPYPGEGGFRPDDATARLALEHLERERPDFLFLGLGEPDEYAHRGDYAGYVGSLRAADRVVGELEATLARMGPRGRRTHVLVTTDHGRAASFRDHGEAFPESAAVWLVAWGPAIEARGAIAAQAERHLADLAPTARVILGMPSASHAPGGGVVLRELLEPEDVASR